ncbi:MAG: FAD:protein transferase [Candidatus Saccharibacteria bacterium]|nr:FAD:protein transferase [Candidatus Saccharibacteria bacterium]
MERIDAHTQTNIAARLEAFDKTYSRFRDDSLVARMAEQAGTYVFPDDFPDIMKLYLQCYNLTDGRMTPLIGGAMEQAGYDKTYRLRPTKLLPVPSIDVIDWDGERTLTTSMPIVFDIGAAGKGYAVDEVAVLLETAGIGEYVIDASGDIRHRGLALEKIGLEHPHDSSKIIGVADIVNQSLCASASNRRQWGELHHIFDPQTLTPVRDVIATWAIASDTVTADAMATALFFVKKPDQLMETFRFSYVRMFNDGHVERSLNFKGELFT